MKGRWKVLFCVLLAVFALVSLATVLGRLGVVPVSAPADSYLLREYEGCIGVYYPADAAYPTMITDIRVRDLPLADRFELINGVGASDYGAVVRLLEDYGS